jgi:hypothetical protein
MFFFGRMVLSLLLPLMFSRASSRLAERIEEPYPLTEEKYCAFQYGLALSYLAYKKNPKLVYGGGLKQVTNWSKLKVIIVGII